MKINRIKRYSVICVVSCLLVIFAMSIVSFADDTEENLNGSTRLTTFKVNRVSDAEKFIELFFKKNNVKIEIGSIEYVDYLTDLLMFEDDKNLKELPQYEDIKIYASEYLSNLNVQEAVVEKDKKFFLNKDEQDKTIDLIKEEAREEMAAEEKYDNVLNESIEPNGYNDSDAVKYAKKWAKSRNSKYKSHSADCTNFVSQCVKAGGKSMSKPSSIPVGVKDTTKYWYSVRYEEWHTNHYIYRWKESTSFIRVSDFYTYWKNKGIATASYSSKAKLQNGAKIGDVVQLKKGDGKWFHSIIITGGSKGARKYCGHSKDRLDEPVKNISGAVSYRALKF